MPIVTISQIQPISIVFTLPQDDLPEVQKPMAQHTLHAIAYDQSDRTKLDEGTLLLVNNTVDQSSGHRHRVRATPAARLRDGRRPGGFPDPHTVHHAGGLYLHGQAAARAATDTDCEPGATGTFNALRSLTKARTSS